MGRDAAVAPTFRPANPDDEQHASATLALAFAADPAMRFLLPEATRYHARAQELIGAAVSIALENGSLHVVEGCHGVAVWFAPGVRIPQATVQELVRRAVDEDRLEEVTAGLISSGGFDPGGACWRLQMIGVDPLRQGRGIASCLLRQGLELIDQRRATA